MLDWVYLYPSNKGRDRRFVKVVEMSDLNPRKYSMTDDIFDNMMQLCSKLQKIEAAFGRPLKVTSGLRSEELQKVLITTGKSNAQHSKHLIGAAADIADPTGDFYRWCQDNSIEDHDGILCRLGLWMENRQPQENPMNNWQHLQIYPPKSGRRWFDP